MALQDLLVDNSAVTYGAIGFVAAITVVIIAELSRRPNLDAFQAVGSNTWLGSWLSGLKYVTNAQGIIQDGYDTYKTTPFKIADPKRWMVMISDRRHMEELSKAPEDTFSFWAAVNDHIQLEHTLGPAVYYNPYHIAVIRSHLTRNIEVLYPEIRDEIVIAFAETLNLRGTEWKSAPALSVAEKVVCRASNRIFVGLPFCRNPDWIDLNIRTTVDTIKMGVLIGIFPKFMRPLAARFLSSIFRNTRRGMKLVGPIIEERQKYLKASKCDDKPNDLLSWLMDEAEGPELTTERLTTRLLAVNLSAIHATSNSFAMALLYLAANPQYIKPLREEVEAIVSKDGWSKSSLAKMRKVDSFLKESQRIEGIGIVTLARKALKDFTFSDGTFIPKGAIIAAATHALHHDETLYNDPNAFEPFRFADIHEEDGKGKQHQFTAATTEYLAFGYGKFACSGRFFAANQLKSMLAHVVVTYDVKLEEDRVVPFSVPTGPSITVNRRAKVMFRLRVD